MKEDGFLIVEIITTYSKQGCADHYTRFHPQTRNVTSLLKCAQGGKKHILCKVSLYNYPNFRSHVHCQNDCQEGNFGAIDDPLWKFFTWLLFQRWSFSSQVTQSPLLQEIIHAPALDSTSHRFSKLLRQIFFVKDIYVFGDDHYQGPTIFLTTIIRSLSHGRFSLLLY